MKKKYIKPETEWMKIDSGSILAGTTIEIDNKNQATGPACSKENKSYSVWNWEEDDFEEED